MGERGWGRSPGVGDGSPGSREAEGEGGEGFYIAQSGRCPDLLVIFGGVGCEGREEDSGMSELVVTRRRQWQWN